MSHISPADTSQRFPDTFVFGGATAAYQVEGACQSHGKGKVAWDDYLAQQGRFSPEPACDFYNRYDSDLELCERFGMNGIRVSIAWSRIFPDGGVGEPNPEGVAFYHNLFASCRAHGVEPYVTLHHFDSPAAIYANGDFLNRDTIDAFEAYARFCFDEYLEVTRWFTFNEIAAATLNRYVEGTWPQGKKGCLHECLQAQHNMMLAHARAVLAYKQGGYPGTIGVIHALEYKYPYDPACPGDIQAAKNDDVLQNRLLLDATFRGDYAPDTLQIIEHLCQASNGSVEFWTMTSRLCAAPRSSTTAWASTITKAVFSRRSTVRPTSITTAQATRAPVAGAWRAWASAPYVPASPPRTGIGSSIPRACST